MFKKQEVELIKNQLAKLFDNYIEKVMIYDAGLELIQEQANQQQSRIKRAKQLINGDTEDTPQTSLNI